MKKKGILILIIALVIIAAWIVISAVGLEFDATNTIWALFPPIFAIVLALITKEVYSSLFLGVLSGAMIYSKFDFVGTVDVLTNDGVISAVSGTAGIFIFLVLLGVIVALINKTGGSAAFGNWAATHIKTRVGAMFATFVLGILIFVDDYFNCLTVGSVMRPVADSKKISRAKLAYLIDATAAPVCMIAPVSSWAAAVTVAVAGTSIAENVSGFQLFCQAIPYNYYSLLTFVFIIAIVLMKFDYGPMKLHEFNAATKGDLFTTGEYAGKNEDEEKHANGKVIDLILPVVILIITCIAGMLYTGGILEGASLIDAFSDCDATVGLPLGSFVALVIIVIYLMARGLVTFKDSMACIPKGFCAMVPPILILTLATALKNMTGLLGAAEYVGMIMDSAAAGLANFLPAIIFLVACVLAFASGTSWGTFGILIPIVCEMFSIDSSFLVIGISACLAGAVCGDHCSPISDTTIMASAGAQSDHLNHVSTQLPYAITVAAISFVTYVIAGFVQNWIVLLAIGVVLTIATLFVIKKISSKKNAA
ncbi:MAG: Na+/H+ antiporter NhaC family protein [Christensenellaceae bacterium]|nr:Na+/H+ antiporter NhaC family protein [Christensenellaceae bacterium]